MTRKTEKPFDKIVLTRGKLDMYVQYGDAVLKGQTPQEFAAEVQEAFAYLLDFRNMVSAMAKLDEAPAGAVRMYLD